MQTNRIPEFSDKSFDGMLMWFSEMQVRGLLFHPDDDPADIIRISDSTATFFAPEVKTARTILGEMFELHGDNVYEAVYPIAMNAAGIQLDA